MYTCFGSRTWPEGLFGNLFPKIDFYSFKSYIFHFNTPQVNLISDWTLNWPWALEFKYYWGTGARVVRGTKCGVYTSQGLCCYKAMPFGLKNAGATYQRLVNCMFSQHIGRNVEVYVDDMLVKSRDEVDHLDDLKETFDTLRKYKMKLNPTKYVFAHLKKILRFHGVLNRHRGKS